MNNIQRMPRAEDMEKAVLGALILETPSWDLVEQMFKPELFYTEQHQVIATAIQEIHQETGEVDLLTVTQRIVSNGKSDLVSAFYITELTSAVNSAAHIEKHFRIVQEMAIKREAINVASRVLSAAYDETNDAFEILSLAEIGFSSIVEDIAGTKDRNLAQIGKERRKQYGKKMTDFVSIGWPIIDDTGILIKKEVTGFGGMTGTGKTALACEIALRAAKSKIPVGIISQEMSDEQMYDRMLSNYVGVKMDTIKHSSFNETDWQQIGEKGDEFESLPIQITEGRKTALQITRQIRQWVAKYGIEIVMVDYHQRVDSQGKGRSLDDENMEVAIALKEAARRYNVVIIDLIQFNKNADQRTDKRPILGDLRNMGTANQELASVVCLYSPERNGEPEKDGYPTTGLMQAFIRKNRHGKLGEFKLKFKGDHQKFTEWHNYQNTTDTSSDVIPASVWRFPEGSSDLTAWE